MKNRVLSLLLTIVILLAAGMSAVHAEILPPYGEGQIGLTSAVLCESLTVRQEPSSSSAAVKTVYYGDLIMVIEQEDGWAKICTSDAVDAGPDGWVNADYLAIDPAWCRLDASAPVYAWNDTAAPKVAYLSAGTMLPVLKDEGSWVLVSLRGAAGWIYVGSAR